MAKKEGDQEVPEPLKYQIWILKVSIHCEGCKRKVKKILKTIDGVYTTEIDLKQHKVTVTGNVDGDTLIKKLVRSGKQAQIWPDQKRKNEKPKSKDKEDGDLEDGKNDQQNDSPEKNDSDADSDKDDGDGADAGGETSTAAGGGGGGGGNSGGGGGGGKSKKKKKKKKKKKEGQSGNAPNGGNAEVIPGELPAVNFHPLTYPDHLVPPMAGMNIGPPVINDIVSYRTAIPGSATSIFFSPVHANAHSGWVFPQYPPSDLIVRSREDDDLDDYYEDENGNCTIM